MCIRDRTNAVITGGDYAHTWPVGFTATDALMKGGSHYYPESGILKIETTANHGMNNGDWIKFNDNAITLECTQGAGQHSYPRSTDPVSGRWLQIFNKTLNSFEVKVLDTVPSTNVTTHKVVAAAANAIVHKDPLSGNAVAVSNVTPNTFDIQVLNKAPSTNTTVHTLSLIHI